MEILSSPTATKDSPRKGTLSNVYNLAVIVLASGRFKRSHSGGGKGVVLSTNQGENQYSCFHWTQEQASGAQAEGQMIPGDLWKTGWCAMGAGRPVMLCSKNISLDHLSG